MNKEIYYKYFYEQILPNIYPLEIQRKDILKRVFLYSLLMFVCGILSAYVFILLAIKNNITILLLPVILFLMYVFFLKGITYAIVKGKEYQNLLMQKVLPYFLKPIANFTFWPKNHDIATFLDSKLFRDFENREDYLSLFGIYKNANITINDTELTIPVNKSVFKGIAIQLELDKSINNHIIMISKNEKKNNPYKQIKSDIDELNQYMYVFAQNENTQLITDKFWQAVKRIGETYGAKGFLLSIKNDTVLICLRRKRPLKFGFLLKSLIKPQNFDDLINMFLVLFDFIDSI